jgi:protein-disulfide isomerase
MTLAKGTLVAVSLGLGSLLALCTAGAAGAASATDESAPPPLSSHTVVATIGRERITEADVAAANREAFDKLEKDYNLALRQVRLKQLQQRHDLLQQRLDALLDARALDLEAKARGTTTAAVLADIKVPAVTEEEERQFYEDNKTRTKETFEALQARITEHLASEHNQSATRSFYDGLRRKYGITSLVEPYRVAVAATGPSRGNDAAPVTIVEFGDFQCPYCREAEASLHTILTRYPGEVRLVFRNLPLASLHPNATAAAEAAVCAGRQGMFWEMHDAMYENQQALSPGGLKEIAKHVGLKSEGFDACMADPGTKEAVESDMKAADELDVTGTPYFFINGRPLNGSVPLEQFESLITDELQRHASRRDESNRG